MDPIIFSDSTCNTYWSVICWITLRLYAFKKMAVISAFFQSHGMDPFSIVIK